MKLTPFKFIDPKDIPRRVPLADRLRKPIRSRDGDGKVRVRGQRLSRVLMRGSQWAVTSHGMEALDGTYAIRREDLLKCDDEGRQTWPTHVAGKTWVDASDFVVVYAVALVAHGYCGPFASIDAVLGRPPKKKVKRGGRP